MIKCRVKPITEWRYETVFTNPKCGHIQTFDYCAPKICQNTSCRAEVEDIDKLFGKLRQSNRVKFYIEGKI